MNRLFIPIIILLFLSCSDRLSESERRLHDLSETTRSASLTAEQIDGLVFTEDYYAFDDSTRGRKLANLDWIAIERNCLSLQSDPDRFVTFHQLCEMEERGEVDGSTMVIVHFKWAAVRGDSANVASTLRRGQINWHLSPPDEPGPTNPIGPITNGDCEVAE